MHNTKNRAGRVAHVVEHLPSKCEALSLNSSTEKTERAETEGNIPLPIIQAILTGCLAFNDLEYLRAV
jgi:hypothetical protein